jgi:hypothetical protein
MALSSFSRPSGWGVGVRLQREMTTAASSDSAALSMNT